MAKPQSFSTISTGTRQYDGSIKAERVVDFQRHLTRHLPGNLLIIWDGLPAHRSRLVKSFLAELDGRIWLEKLPAYAPELNPAEYVWGYWKKHELPNFCPKDYEIMHNSAATHARRWAACVAERH